MLLTKQRPRAKSRPVRRIWIEARAGIPNLRWEGIYNDRVLAGMMVASTRFGWSNFGRHTSE